MTRKPDLDAIIELADVRAARGLAATQAALLPDETTLLDAEELSRRVAEQLSTLPRDQGLLLRRKMLVAVHDLESLVDALQEQMNTLALELRKVSSHSSAATAYSRPVRRPSDHRS
ncbi:MAG: hypothetical protein ACM31D_19265 [Bacteroidota bacterium]